MKKIHKVLLMLLGVIALAVMGFWAMQTKEPEYQGRRLSQWMRDLDRGTPAEKLAARQILQATNKEILPLIEARLQSMEDVDTVWLC